jgi:hypothetical protein
MRILLLFLTLAVTGRAQTNAAAPDPAALLATAKSTAEKLNAVSAAWTCALSTAQATINVDVLQAPANRRLIFTVILPNAAAPIELARMIETPTSWYVTQPGKRFTKHRPYEAEFEYPVISLAHTLAQPRFLAADDAKRLTKFIARDGDLARYAIPGNPALIRNALAQYDNLAKTNPNAASDAKFQKTVAALRTALDPGVPLTIDTRTGILTEYATAKVSVAISNFHFVDPAPASLEPEIARQTWKDFTDDPTAGGTPQDLLMIGHYAAWRPGQPSGDFEALLLNMATGRSRRVPFAGIAAIPGCFVRDRAAVIVSGMELDQGTVHLYEIDLKTGVNRLLGGETLAIGQTLMPVLSPDGKTLAAHYKNFKGSVLDSQIALIDLASGNARVIGEPFDGAYVNWTPDGKGLMLLKRQYAKLNEHSDNTVCRMDLSGVITPLFKGDVPLVVNDNQILFEHPGDRAWQLCDLDGKNPHPLGDGLPRLAFPTASPDGKRLLMMSINPATGPRPVIIDLANPQPQPLELPGGLWAAPAWR